MKLYCYHTPSHDRLFEEYFVPSFKDTFEVVNVRDSEQWCPSGNFRRAGWQQTQCNKVQTWIEALETDEIFVGSDVDIQWFGPTRDVLLSALGENEMAVQTFGGRSVCSGFFICRSTESTLRLWKSILADLGNGLAGGEQDLLRRRLNNKEVAWTKLPEGQFWSPAFCYAGLEELAIPPEILMHHATYTVGVDNKIAQMQYVRRCVERMKEGTRT